MRWLGMAAAIGTVLAAVLNIIWFSRHLAGFGAFVTVAWPAVLGTVAFMAFTVFLGIVTVRLMLRRDAEDEARAAAEALAKAEDPSERDNDAAALPVDGTAPSEPEAGKAAPPPQTNSSRREGSL